MDTPAISEVSFLDLAGCQVQSPLEWERYQLVLPIAPETWEDARLSIQGASIEIALAHVEGVPRVVADWGRRGAGAWQCVLSVGGLEVLRQTLVVSPRKLDAQAFEQMLVDIDEQLIGSILFSLEKLGAFGGQSPRPPNPSTLAEELQRIERAVLGDETGPGLAGALTRIAKDPHRILSAEPIWVRAEAARSPIADRLPLAYGAAQNVRARMLDPEVGLERVWDARVEHTFDVYENRILKTFVDDVALRLRRLSARLAKEQDRLDLIRAQLDAARRSAKFLDDVSALQSSPRNPSMVLLKRPDYQIAYRRWLEYRKFSTLSLNCSARSSPLENTPLLYEIWGTLLAVDTLLQCAADHGWRIARQELFVVRDGWCADLAWSGSPIIVLENLHTGARLKASPQRSFSRSGNRLRSISLTQRPDLVIEHDQIGQAQSLIILDPKYKLVADAFAQGPYEELAEEDRDLSAQGKPLKSDIDKMHAYRDAIRDCDGRRATAHAAIIYPGRDTTDYSGEVAAIGTRPGDTSQARSYLRDLFERLVFVRS